MKNSKYFSYVTLLLLLFNFSFPISLLMAQNLNQDILLIDIEQLSENSFLSKHIQNHYDINSERVVWTQDDVNQGIKNGVIQKEHVPKGELIKFIYNKGFISKVVRSFVNQKILSHLYGHFNNRSVSEKEILSFIKTILNIPINNSNYSKINQEFHEMYGKGINDFHTINEIFARSYTPNYFKKIVDRNLVKKGDLISPTTSRVRFIEDIKSLDYNFHLTDKNISGHENSFNVRNLFGSSLQSRESFLKGDLEKTLLQLAEQEKKIVQKKNISKLKDLYKKMGILYEKFLIETIIENIDLSTMIVFRLAPSDYHRIHFPFSEGKVLGPLDLAIKSDTLYNSKILHQYLPYFQHYRETEDRNGGNNPAIHLDGKYLSVSTLATTSSALKYNPLIENVRDILFFEIEKDILIPFILVGATGVGSNNITIKRGQTLHQGDEIGHFEFGASTVIMFLPKGTFSPNSKIKQIQNIFYELPVLKNDKENKGKILREMEVFIPIGTVLFHSKQ